jgi:hypothetical protein
MISGKLPYDDEPGRKKNLQHCKKKLADSVKSGKT